MTIYNVGNSAPTCLVTNAVQNDTWITNTSSYTLYISSDANVNITNYDYVLTAGSSVQWSAGIFAYAIFPKPFTGPIEITGNALNLVNQNSITSGSSSAYDILYDGPVYTNATDASYSTYIPVSAYQSVKIKIYPKTPVGSWTFPPGPACGAGVLNNNWSIGWAKIVPSPSVVPLGTTLASPYFFDESFGILNSNTASQSTLLYHYGFEATVQVKAPFLIPFFSPVDNDVVNVVSQYWNMEIVGCSIREPSLYYERAYPQNSNVNFSISTPGSVLSPISPSTQAFGAGGLTVPVGTSPNLVLPSWSGKVQASIQCITDVAPTLAPYFRFYPLHQSSGASGAGLRVTLTAAPSSTRDLGANLTFSGYRQPLGVSCISGTGYTTNQIILLLTFYGNEDS